MRINKGLLLLFVIIICAAGCTANSKNSISFEGNWKIIAQDGKSDVRVLNLPDVRQAQAIPGWCFCLTGCSFLLWVRVSGVYVSEYAGSNQDAGTPPAGILQAVQTVNEENGTKFTAEIKQHVTIDEVKQLLDEEIPVILDIQAWRDTDNKAEWKDDWIDGHYVVATGYDDENIYFEDPALINSVGSIPQTELLDRWHDYEGADEYDPKTSVITENLIIIIKGEKPQMFDTILHID